MRVNGRNHSGKSENTCATRKRSTPTKAEFKLVARQKSYDMTMQNLRRLSSGTGPDHRSYRRPGSLKQSV